MTLQELIARHAHKAEHGVPDWMPGFWKRYSISFANGMTDLHTHVCWMQSRNFTIDLRLRLRHRDRAIARAGSRRHYQQVGARGLRRTSLRADLADLCVSEEATRRWHIAVAGGRTCAILVWP